MSNIENAVQLFEEGYMCSQAVFAAFSQDLGVLKEDALKIGACFGSGMRKGRSMWRMFRGTYGSWIKVRTSRRKRY